jgi:hypothetical protein
LLAISGRADPLDTWTWRNPLPTANDLSGIAYADGQFVAVGEAGTILTSTNGLEWVQRPSATELPLAAVAYGNGRFVAVGGDTEHPGDLRPSSIIVTSTNGANWIATELPGQGRLNGVAYGAGQFVAVGVNGLVATSSDGLIWAVTRPGPQYSSLNAVNYANGKFVVVGANPGFALVPGLLVPGLVLVSTDGLSWAQADPGTNNLYSVAYGNGEFVAVGWSDSVTSSNEFAPHGVILTSTDGMSWDLGQAGTQGLELLSGLAYGDGQFVAVGQGPILISTNGENWSTPFPVTPCCLKNVAYGGGRFVAVGFNGAILSSTDAGVWSGAHLDGTTNLVR